MCELLGMECNVPTDIVFSFHALALRGGLKGPHGDGWGLALYERKAARVFLEPRPAADSELARYIRENPIKTLLAQGKEHRDFNGRTFLLETAYTADYALIPAWKADTFGNLQFRLAQRNFNPLMAMAAKVTIAEVEEPIVAAGDIDPDHVHTSGIFVHRLVQLTADAIWQPKPLEVAR